MMVFLIPPDSGERIGFSVTILLALAVFLTLVGNNLPQTSTPMPVLCNYLMAVLVVSITLCVLVIINLRFHHRDESSVPPNVCRKFTRFILFHTCSKRKNTSTDNVHQTKVHPSHATNIETKRRVNSDAEIEENIRSKHNVNWKDFGFAMDITLFILFFITNIALNVYFICILSIRNEGYEEK